MRGAALSGGEPGCPGRRQAAGAGADRGRGQAGGRPARREEVLRRADGV